MGIGGGSLLLSLLIQSGGVPVDEAGLKGLSATLVACLRKDVRVGLGVSTPLSPVIDALDNMMGGEFESWTGVPR